MQNVFVLKFFLEGSNMQRTKIHSQRAAQFAAARRYADANKSDPFAYSVALSHIRNGLCDGSTKDGATFYYDATLSGHNDFGHPVFNQVQRP